MLKVPDPRSAIVARGITGGEFSWGRQSRAAFENHYLTCAECAAMVERTDQFIKMLRGTVAGPPERT